MSNRSTSTSLGGDDKSMRSSQVREAVRLIHIPRRFEPFIHNRSSRRRPATPTWRPLRETTRGKAKPMRTAMNDQADQGIVRAWALLDRAEHLARQAVRDEAGPSLWLLAANSILRARDALEAIHPGRTSHHWCGRAARRELQGPGRGGGRAACEHPPRPRTSRAVVGPGPSGRGRTRSRRAAVSVNTPTVQELLQDASREVRSIMWDVTALDGPGLAAAWPSFAAHSREALSAVPLPDAGTRLLIHRAAGPRYRPNRWGPPVDAAPASSSAG